jgi:hypothetical protein
MLLISLILLDFILLNKLKTVLCRNNTNLAYHRVFSLDQNYLDKYKQIYI